ncbi:MAG: carboxysome peptide B [Thiotrichales bacterium]|nr:carboxysome peptide B [Thiotrichales bacterium]
MDIMRVVASLVCTRRHSGLLQSSLRILRDSRGKLQVAADPCGARPGNWVFVSTGSAARFACDNPKTLTDLTINGIIDYWDEETGQTKGMLEEQVIKA